MRILAMFLITGQFLMTAQSFAEKSKGLSAAKKQDQVESNFVIPQPKFVDIDVEKYLVGVKPSEAWKTSRKPAAAEMFNPSQAFITRRDQFLNCATSDCVAALIDTLDSEYQTYTEKENDLRFFAAQLLALKPLRSFLYKTEGLYSDFWSSATSSTVHGVIRRVFTNVDFLFPRSQWSATLDYIQVPTKDFVQWKKQKQVQEFILKDVFAYLDKSQYLLQVIADSLAGGKDFVVDTAAMLDSETFRNTKDIYRYRLAGRAEALLAQGKLQSWKHRLMIFCAYDIEAAARVNEEMLSRPTKLFNTDQSKSTEWKTKILNGHKDFLTLHAPKENPEEGRKRVQDSLRYLELSIRLYAAAWESFKARSFDENYLIPSARLKRFEGTITDKIEKAQELVNPAGSGWVDMHSQLDSTVAFINLREFHTRPPSDLKKLLPKNFNTETVMIGNKKTEKAKDKLTSKDGIKYKNYREGQGIIWEDNVWSQYIRYDIAQSHKKDSNWVKDAVRVFGESWAGSDLAEGLAFFVK